MPSTVCLESLSAPKQAITYRDDKVNNINMLAHNLCMAPMMDWAGTSRKAKLDQQLSIVRK